MLAVWKTVRVFISSTFRDMHAERDHLVKVVFPRLRLWCDQRRLHLDDIDLRWGLTKEDVDNGNAIEVCLQEIDRSRPFFVSILGNRYGWVPDAPLSDGQYLFQGSEQGTGLSITHLEIIHATKEPFPRKDGSRERVCQQAFFYLRKPDCVPSAESLAKSTGPQRRYHAETFFEHDPLHRRKLDELKEDIRARFQGEDRVWDYQGVWDPDAGNPEDHRLKGRLVELDAFGARVESDLQRAIESGFAEHLASLGVPIEPLIEERSYHEAFIEHCTRVYVPRREVEDRLTRYVAPEETDRRALVLSGPPGSGKSAILASWVRQRFDAAERDGEFLLARFVGASPASTQLPRLLANLAHELRERFALTEEVEEDDERVTGRKETGKRLRPMEVPGDPAKLLAKWPFLLEAAAAKGRVVIVLDALNQLDCVADSSRLNWLTRQLPSGVRLIVSVLDHAQRYTAERLPAEGEPFDWLAALRRMELLEVPVPGLNEAERREVIRHLPSIFCKTLGEAEVDELLRNAATCNPLFLIVALEELRVFGSFEELPGRIRQLPFLRSKPGPVDREPDEMRGSPSSVEAGQRKGAPVRDIEHALDAMFAQVVDRLDREAAREMPGLASTIFRLLASAREGLTEQELRELLSRALGGADEKRRNGSLGVVLRQVRMHLMRKGPLIDFYHRSFWKAVQAKYLHAAAARITAHRELAELFQVRRRSPDAHALSELPFHQVRAQMWDDLGETLCDLAFLEDKAEAGMVIDLVGDFSAAVQAIPPHHKRCQFLRLLGEALRRDSSFIARHPTSLFQCLWNSCWWYDGPAAVARGGLLETVSWNLAVGKGGLARLLESWRRTRDDRTPEREWLRGLRAPPGSLHAAQQRILRGHTGWVNAIAFSPDRCRLASASSDATVRIWDVASGEVLAVLAGHEADVQAVAFSPDERWVASGACDRTVRVWDAESYRLRLCLNGHEGSVNAVAFSPDSRSIASASGDVVNPASRVRIWDVCTEELLMCLDGVSGGTDCLSYSPDGGHLAAGGRFGSYVIFWDAKTGEETDRLAAHESHLRFTFSDDGHYLATCGLDLGVDRSIRVWGTVDGRELSRLWGHHGEILGLAFGANGRLASGGADGTVRIWQVPRVSLSTRLSFLWRDITLRRSPDERSVNQLACLRGHDGEVRCVAILPDGRLVASGGRDHTVRLWEGRMVPRPRYNFPDGVFHGTKDGSFGLGVVDGTVIVQDLEKGYIGPHAPPLFALAFSPNGKWLATGGADGTVVIWDSAGAPRPCMGMHSNLVPTLAFSPDSMKLASGAWDGTVCVWDVATGEALTTICPSLRFVSAVAFLPDSQRVITGAWHIMADPPLADVGVWDVRTGARVASYVVDSPDVCCLAVSSDGSQVAAGCQSSSIFVWEAKTGRELIRLPGLAGGTEQLAYLPGDRIAGSGPAQARVWDRNGKCLKTYAGRTDPSGMSSRWLLFYRDGEMLIDSADSERPVAWFPGVPSRIAAHPSGRTWAAVAWQNLYLIALEGDRSPREQ